MYTFDNIPDLQKQIPDVMLLRKITPIIFVQVHLF